MSGFWDFLSDPKMINAIGSGLQASGQVAGARATLDMGDQAATSAHFTADQLRQQAGSAEASAQRSAYFEDLNAKYVASAALASAAASGGGASDPTVINNIAQIAQIGAYKQQVALYQGQDRARVLDMQAAATEFEGESKKKASRGTATGQLFQAGSTLLKGYAKDSSFFQRYGAGGASSYTSDD